MTTSNPPATSDSASDGVLASMLKWIRRIASDLKGSWLQLVIYALAFEVATSLILGPALTALTNRTIAAVQSPVVANKDLMGFFLSPGGIVAVLVMLTSVLLLSHIQNAGLQLIYYQAINRERVSPLQVVGRVLAKIPTLLRLSLRQTAIGLAATVPFLAAAGLTHWLLLSATDINYYLTARPWQFWTAGAIAAVLAVAAAGVFISFYLRWLFAVAMVMLEGRGPTDALRESAKLTHGRTLRVGIAVGLWRSISIAAGLVVSALAAWAAGRLLGLADGSLTSLAWSAGAALIVHTGILTAFSTVDSLVLASIVVALYAEKRGLHPTPALPGEPAGSTPLAWLGRLLTPRGLIVAGLAILLVATATAWFGLQAVQSMSGRKPVSVIAHRAGSRHAPENTLAALRRAIDAGADDAEIDVQLSSDAVVMVVHDQDFARTGGDRRRVANLTAEQMATIDVGRLRAEEFAGEMVPTLGQFLQTAGDRIGLVIELKYFGPDERLVPAVLAECAKYPNTRVMLASLEYAALQQARRLKPDAPLAFIVSAEVGQLTRADAQVLMIRAGLLRPDLVRRAGQSGVSLWPWTVNTREAMTRSLLLGADGLITDDAVTAASVLADYRALNDVEWMLLRLQNTLRTTVSLPPLPADEQ